MYRSADIRVGYIHEYTTVRLLSLKLHLCITQCIAERIPALIMPVCRLTETQTVPTLFIISIIIIIIIIIGCTALSGPWLPLEVS
jgi:hypothetical protein